MGKETGDKKTYRDLYTAVKVLSMPGTKNSWHGFFEEKGGGLNKVSRYN